MLSLKAELAKLRHDFDSSNLTRPQQSQHVTNVQNSGEEDISSVTTVPQPNAEPERHLASNDIPDPDSSSVTKDKKSQSHKKREAENIVQDVFDFTTTSAPEKNHMTEISMTENSLPVTENTNEKNSIV
ncbi:unnamed protein product [Rhizophagus irregularis]|nr:unnamed protein product [Rhizophagus irregularis]